MGFTTDAPVSLGRDIRQNENCVIIADDTMWLPIYRRVADQMPSPVAGGVPAGLNQRWRLYKYGPGDIFKMHTGKSSRRGGEREGEKESIQGDGNGSTREGGRGA